MMNLVDCPDCGRINNAALEKCRECGKELSRVSSGKDRVKCPYCAESISAHALKCKYCHEYLTSETPSGVNMRTTLIRRERTSLARCIALMIDSFVYFSLSSLCFLPFILIIEVSAGFFRAHSNWTIIIGLMISIIGFPLWVWGAYLSSRAIFKLDSGTQSIGKRAFNLHVVELNTQTVRIRAKRLYGLLGESSQNKKLSYRIILKWGAPFAALFLVQLVVILIFVGAVLWHDDFPSFNDYVGATGLFWSIWALFFIINAIWMIPSKHHQTIYDRISGTYVEREEALVL
jgi:uncharacterized RDD family membrane protein YckC